MKPTPIIYLFIYLLLFIRDHDCVPRNTLAMPQCCRGGDHWIKMLIIIILTTTTTILFLFCLFAQLFEAQAGCPSSSSFFVKQLARSKSGGGGFGIFLCSRCSFCNFLILASSGFMLIKPKTSSTSKCPTIPCCNVNAQQDRGDFGVGPQHFVFGLVFFLGGGSCNREWM